MFGFVTILNVSWDIFGDVAGMPRGCRANVVQMSLHDVGCFAHAECRGYVWGCNGHVCACRANVMGMPWG